MIHKPVMVGEIVTIFADVPAGVIIDATYGFGGHTKALEENSKGRFRFIGIDCDSEILETAGKDRPSSVTLRKMNFSELPRMLSAERISPVSGALFDLGLNSAHLDDPDRGFSYQKQSMLDLRFDRYSGEPAAEALKKIDRDTLVSILKEYGQETHARAIARSIVENKPTTTDALAGLIRRIAGPRGFSKAAARVFQALRIYINDELAALEKALGGVIPLLVSGGRVAVISYHSLEDRIVKRIFLLNAGKCFCGPEAAECSCGKKNILKINTKKPIRPSPSEVRENPRARSARLRYAEKI